MRIRNNRVAAIVAGATVLVAFGTTGGAVAAGLVGSMDIRDESIRSVDIKDGEVRLSDISDRAEARLEGRDGKNGVDGKDAVALSTAGNLLYVNDGATALRTVSYELAKPVALKDFNLTFFQERVFGDGNFGASVILGVDGDADGRYEANDLAWHFNRLADMSGDSFLEMDAAAPTTVKVDATATAGWFENTEKCAYGTFDSVATCVGKDKMVHVVRFVVGGSSSWSDEAVRVTAPALQGTATVVNYDKPAS